MGLHLRTLSCCFKAIARSRNDERSVGGIVLDLANARGRPVFAWHAGGIRDAGGPGLSGRGSTKHVLQGRFCSGPLDLRDVEAHEIGGGLRDAEDIAGGEDDILAQRRLGKP